MTTTQPPDTQSSKPVTVDDVLDLVVDEQTTRAASQHRPCIADVASIRVKEA